MMALAQHGLIGPAGMNAVPIAMAEPSREAENVKMGTKGIARGQPLMNNSAIDNHADLQWSTGKTQTLLVGSGSLFAMNIFPQAKH